jgi:hypothetical protein
MITLTFQDIAARAGFIPGADGKLNLPATQETADALAAASVAMLPAWTPGDAPVDATLTGAGPVWGYLTIAHALHGRVGKLLYAAPNTPFIAVFNHGR